MDPSVLLRAYKSPQWPDPVEEYKGFLSLRQMMDLGKQRQQQYQIQQLEMQQKQQELEDQRRLREALATGAPLTGKETVDDLIKRGIPLDQALKILTNFRTYNTAASQEKTADLTRQEKEAALETKRQQEVADTLYGVRSLPPEKRQAAMDLLAMSELDPRIKGEFTSLSGLVAPDKPLGIQKPGMPTPLIEPAFRAPYAAAYNPQQLQSLLSGEATAKAAADKAKFEESLQDAKKRKEEADALKAEAEDAGRTLGFVGDQEGLDAWYKDLSPKMQAKVGPPPRFNPTTMQRLDRGFRTAEQRDAAAQRAVPNTEFEAAYESTDPNLPKAVRASQALKRLDQSRRESKLPPINITVPGYGSVGTPATQQLTGDAFLKTLSPAAAAEIRAMAEGRAAAPSASSRTAGAQQKRAALFQYDPNWSETRAQVRKAFTTGKDAQNIGALNTAMVHLGRLDDAAAALGNGSFTPGNEMYQYFADKFGSATVTNFQLLKDAVAGEMAAALKGNATDIEIENMKRSIRASNSPAQMRGVVTEGIGILSDKANTYDERYHRENPDDTVWSPILPSAKATMQRFGVTGRGAAAETPKAAPPIGTVKNGYYFKGGNPAVKENWIKTGK